MNWFVGVDVGGTFTDFFAFNETSTAISLHKRPSTPENPATAILAGLDDLARDRGVSPTDISRFAHGTTVATNALIQRRGANIALITTKGFRDLLEIGRQIRPKMYNLKADEPPPLVPREHRFEVSERIGADGQIVVDLTDKEIKDVIERIRASGAEACAIGFLFAFLNADHEDRIAAAIKAALPGVHLSLSSGVQPEFREYERLSTTVLNAYLQPAVTRYMESLKAGLIERAPVAAIGINQSSGGLMSVERAGEYPIRTALSGPAAGVIGAVHIAQLAGYDDVITLDMGGTSADVALIQGGKAGISFDQRVADYPVRLPMVDVNTIGAGGGSIAWFDRDGLLKVGPASAGAEPGPACYGLGGTEPTISDANLVLGRLSPRGLLDGKLALNAALSENAFSAISEELGFSVERTAHGVIGIVVANMVRAIRAISVERGHDPRAFALMALGGAGPLHAVDVARILGISAVIIPPAPGILCAQGLVVSDLKEDFVASERIQVDDENLDTISNHVSILIERAQAWFEDEKISSDQRWLELNFDMRYVGQNFELAVPVGETNTASREEFSIVAEKLMDAFYAAHEQAYGYFNPHDPAEAVNLRLTAWGRLKRPEIEPGNLSKEAAAASGTRSVYYSANGAVEAQVYNRDTLVPGHKIEGPAVVEQLDTTVLIYPGDTARVDEALNLIIELSA